MQVRLYDYRDTHNPESIFIYAKENKIYKTPNIYMLSIDLYELNAYSHRKTNTIRNGLQIAANYGSYTTEGKDDIYGFVLHDDMSLGEWVDNTRPLSYYDDIHAQIYDPTDSKEHHEKFQVIRRAHT